MPPIILPGGHYARSIAASNAALLVLARNEANGTGVIDVIDFANRTAAPLETLGIYKNAVNPGGVLTASPNGSTILLASPDGNLMLYSAAADTFVGFPQRLSVAVRRLRGIQLRQLCCRKQRIRHLTCAVGTMGTSGSASSGFASSNHGGFMASACVYGQRR